VVLPECALTGYCFAGRKEAGPVADLDLTGPDRNRVVRVPGQWEFDGIAAPGPEMYGPITESSAPP
jgi:predicted amidohydrolase